MYVMECQRRPICDIPDGARCESEVHRARCSSGTHVLRGYINTLCMIGVHVDVHVCDACSRMDICVYLHLYACTMRMYVSWLLSRAGRVAIASDYIRRVRRAYARRYRAEHLILTSVITSLLSRDDRQKRGRRGVTRNLNREINYGAESAAKRTLQNGAGSSEKKRRVRQLDGIFLEREFTYLLLISACTLETIDNCTALTIRCPTLG